MKVVARSYHDPHDLPRLSSFLVSVRSHIHTSHYLHVGDLSWQLFHMLASHDPSEIVRVWEDDQKALLGFVLLYPPQGYFDLQVHPRQRESLVEQQMLAWVEDRLWECDPRYTLVNERDERRTALLEQYGYTRGDPWYYMARSLAEPIPSMHPRSGFRVRPIADDREAAPRAIVLGEAFGAAPDVERYRRFMRAPSYNRDLDIVVVAPDGRFGAFALGWVDQFNKVGQFEPVGTAPAFRRQDLAQLAIFEGLRRMKEHGADQAFVIVEAAELAAQRLYASVGFKLDWSLYLYSKQR